MSGLFKQGIKRHNCMHKTNEIILQYAMNADYYIIYYINITYKCLDKTEPQFDQIMRLANMWCK